MSETTQLTVTEDYGGTRLDLVLAQLLPDISRSRLQQLIADGSVLINGATAKKKDKLHVGDSVCVAIPDDRPLPINPETMTVPILYEDESMLVVNKPPGMAVHPGAGNREGTLVNELLGYNYDQFMAMMDDEERPGIVHRLDKDTSGALVVARTATSKQRLAQAFADRKVGKIYLAICKGIFPDSNEVRVENYLDRHPVDRKKRAVCENGGKLAVSIFKPLAANGAYHLIQAEILTGRMHQIRVHLSHIGCPVVGDVVYGGKAANSDAPRHMLHAWCLRIPHPTDHTQRIFTAPLPDDFREIMTTLNLGNPDSLKPPVNTAL